MPSPMIDPSERDEQPAAPLVANDAALQQVLGIVTDVRDQFSEFRSELHDLRVKLADAATKEDLKQFITRDLADARENAHSERMNALSSRQQRAEDKLDGLRDAWHTRELAEKDRAFDRRTQDDRETAEDHKGLLTRGSDRMWAVLTLVASPILYGIINLIFNHPWSK